ncbi:MAG: hypothetical protein QMD32_06750 [Smithellaceae bacterium]|nr:hypothetical protein [Smithellaceae bacterium]
MTNLQLYDRVEITGAVRVVGRYGVLIFYNTRLKLWGVRIEGQEKAWWLKASCLRKCLEAPKWEEER